MKQLLSFLLALSASAFAGVGDLVGYDELEARLRSRMFIDAPQCIGTPEHVAEWTRIDTHLDATILKPEEIRFWISGTQELGLKPGFILTGVLGDFKPQITSMAHMLGTRFAPDVLSLPMASNHVVNSTNSFAWDLVLTELANKLGGVCKQVKQGEVNLTLKMQDTSLAFAECHYRSVPLNATASEVMKNVCTAADSGDEKALEDYAEELFDMATGFGLPEEEQKAWNEAVASQTQLGAEDRVAYMFRTIFLNPYFLLQW